MDHASTSSVERVPAIPGAVVDALGLRRPDAGGLDRLVKVQALERTIAALRAENLALRIHVQELERLLVQCEEERTAPVGDAPPAPDGNGRPA